MLLCSLCVNHHEYIFNHKNRNPFSVLLQPRSLNIECEAIIDIICISFIILAWSIANIVKLYLVMLEMLFVTKHVQQHKKPS